MAMQLGGCRRRELLDRTLVWHQAHLRRILRAYEIHHNQHRPHRSLDAAAPLKPLPEPVDLDRYRVRRQTHTACLINEYRLLALRGRGFRHAQAEEGAVRVANTHGCAPMVSGMPLPPLRPARTS